MKFDEVFKISAFVKELKKVEVALLTFSEKKIMRIRIESILNKTSKGHK